ncbi:MAG TPA: prepilin-type N-terminal cleavage/methylation domain-containing protein [Longimicrobiales bacterium]
MRRLSGCAGAGRRDRGRDGSRTWRDGACHSRGPWRRARGRGRRGFTLVELLVALAVAGVVALTAQQVLAAALDARARSSTQRELALSAAARRAALESWLRAATLSVPDAPFVGRPGGDAAWPADELAFVVADAGALYPGAHRIRVWLGRDPAAAASGLIAELLPLPVGLAPADTLVLAPAAARLRIRYLDAPGVWVDAWDSEAAGRLPLAVELSIATVPGVAVPPGEELVFAPEMLVPILGASP